MSKFNIYAKKTHKAVEPSKLDRVIEHLRSSVNDHGFSTVSVSRAALSMESLRDDESMQLDTAQNQLSASLESIASELGFSADLTPSQISAGTVAGLIAGDVRGVFNQPVVHQTVATENMSFVNSAGINDAFAKRSIGMEAYDDKDNRNAVVYSIAYNMQAARQDEFGEAFFPTIVVTPDNIGFAISIRLFQVFSDFKRHITGEIDNYGKKNIIRALIDHTILKNDLTKVVPVFRPESAAMFVPTALIPSRTVLLDGESIETSPLAVGKTLSLLAISQTATLIANGLMDLSDSLDTTIILKKVYVKIGDDVMVFTVSNLPLSNFMAAPQGLARQMNLAFQSSSLLVTKTSKRLDGSPLTTLASVAANDLIVRLNINVTGNVNVETATTVVYGNGLEVASVQNASGELVPLTAAPASTIVAALNGATVIGYDLDVNRTNFNRRQRGQLIDTTVFGQTYAVPLRGPFSAVRPIASDGQTDSSDLAALITATRIRTSNEAVTALLAAADDMSSYVDARDSAGVGPDMLGIGRFMVTPTFATAVLDMSILVDSIKSQDRQADINAVLVNKMRDMVYRMYRDSGYKAAADAQNGGLSKTPTVVIGTDPVIAKYIMTWGDMRTMGGEFDFRIVTTLDARMSGRIIMAFGAFDGESENKPNALHFGNMAWKPELTLVLPITRGGATNKELTVQPSFRHIVNCPIMGVIEVQNIQDVVSQKVPLYFHTV